MLADASVFDMSKIQIQKQITTAVNDWSAKIPVCLICQRYKFKSKSQHTVLCSIAKDISLQCHQEDGDGDFAAEGQEDMARIGGTSSVDVGVIDGVKYIARIGGTTTIEMPAIPRVKHIG